MKKFDFIRQGAIFLVIIGINLTNCTKSNINEGANNTSSLNNSNGNTTNTSSLQQLSKDQSNVQTASEDGLNDANNILSPGTTKSRWVPLHSTVDSTVSGDTTIYTITYNGSNGWNRSRTGQIIIKRITLTPWSQQGATVWVTFANYKVTGLSYNKSVTLNGTKLFENVSGGLINDLGNGISQVVYQVTGALQLTFDDTTSRTWNIARRRTYTGTPNQLVLAIEGFGNSTGFSNLDTWGTNRNGELFYTQITKPVVYKLSTCGPDPDSGTIVHQIPADTESATITFGYDFNNQAISSSSSNCPVKFKFDWVKNGHSGTIYILI